jgi:hypothetical protein
VTIFVSPLPFSIPMTSIRAWTDSGGGAPLRCCLRDSQVGERLLLGAVAPPGPLGAYAETGPVFMHADHCPGPASSGYPEAFRARRQVFRAYNNAGQIVGGEIAEPGRNQEEVAERLLSTPGTAFLHSRNLVYGCYMWPLAVSKPGPFGDPQTGRKDRHFKLRFNRQTGLTVTLPSSRPFSR